MCRSQNNLSCQCLLFTFFETWFLLLFTAVYTTLAGPWASSNSPVSISSLQVGVCWDYKMLALQHYFMGSGSPNSGCQSWKITTLPTETSPQALSSALHFKLHLFLLYLFLFTLPVLCTCTHARGQRTTCGNLFSPTMGIPGIEFRANSGLTASTEPSQQPIT